MTSKILISIKSLIYLKLKSTKEKKRYLSHSCLQFSNFLVLDGARRENELTMTEIVAGLAVMEMGEGFLFTETLKSCFLFVLFFLPSVLNYLNVS